MVGGGVMVTNKSGGSGSAPQTLMQAHDLLNRMRPSRDARGDTWLRFYRRSAAVYAAVAEIDRVHHHEAMYWAQFERKKATELHTELATKCDPPVVETVKEQRPDVQTKQ
jgi:hypothetical protein